MNLEILQVPECPNVAVLQDRIGRALEAEHLTATITHRVIDSLAAAEQHGMTGSPTLLIDGRDPFDEPGLIPAVSCRLYPADSGGHREGAPSEIALRAALRGGRNNECSGTSAVFGAWRGVVRPADPAERAVHAAILRAFAFSGGPPPFDDLERLTGPTDVAVGSVLHNLHQADVIRLDGAGGIDSVYPFSATATAHRVQIDGGAEVYAMCAIDALGISAMLQGRPVTISSVDHRTSAPITVRVHGATATADPESTVVFVGAQAVQGPLAETCCGHLNFFTDVASAETWSAANPQVTGMVLDLVAATQCGVAIFGALLTDDSSV
ncbi:alkylmercury lyase [Mycobacterium sp. CBMA271]|uniref:alkylmercury lyase family protein n=1 Tax=unclassified Mycobacteroides TaxID=2618759 RepID=UPI0012DE765A|nr:MULTISPECIES: alkylmercury lyase family protein [unclassified Mycobacteroides]MUM18620.1 hypothetical protein [Mycobacteroides sp. CBMA 326]MUM22583.1 alkylmercury lyase [Mycobacteroides sp. CBMA 271]